MDFNKLKSMGESAFSGSGNQSQGQNQGDQSQQGGTTNTQQQTGDASQEDYGDKGLDFLEKKTGYTQSRETNEKVTDGARGLYEKATGNKLDAKYSN